MFRIGFATLALLASVVAADADEGWGVQFHFDPFAAQTYPMAAMQERTEGMVIDAANLFMTCADDGVAVIFQPERYALNFANAPIEGRFLSAKGPVTFSFAPVDVPYFKSIRAITGGEAKEFIQIFSAATAPVAYQTDKKAGAFPIAGFADVLGIMNDKCSSL